MGKYNIAIVGATGLVGGELIKVLEKRNFPINSIKCFASPKSEGKIIPYFNQRVAILTEKAFENVDIAFFCAGSKVSKEYIPYAKKTIVIDSSSLFRMDPTVPLVIPEINPEDIKTHRGIIASPNCTTSLMLMALFPLHKAFQIKRIVAATYQAASGGGKKLMDKLLQDTKSFLEEGMRPSYGFNLYLHDSKVDDNLYSEEEQKMVHETHKILHDTSIRVSATCVRVPILRAHSIALNVEFKKELSMQKAQELLKSAPGLIYIDSPTPHDATEQYSVFCGRLRKDLYNPNTIDLWVVGDQLLKGAALNAVQIAETLNNINNLR